MEIKLIDYIKNNIDKLSNDNIICYMNSDNKNVIDFAIYQKEYKLYIYFNCLTSYEINLINENDFYLNKVINTEQFVEIKQDDWEIFVKKSIENSIDKNSKIYKRLINEAKFDGGNLVKLSNDDIGMFIGVTSSDEDYYYLIIYKKDNSPKISLLSACGSLDYIKPKNYTEKEYQLIEFINNNKEEIVNNINSLPTDIILNGLYFNKKLTKK